MDLLVASEVAEQEEQYWRSLFDPPKDFHRCLDETLELLEKQTGSIQAQKQSARLMADIYCDIGSALPRWASSKRYGDGTAMDADRITDVRERVSKWFEPRTGQIYREAYERMTGIASILERSNLLRLSLMTMDEDANVNWGHDFGAGLRAAMQDGACMATTNPPIVWKVIQADEERWTARRNLIQTEVSGPREVSRALTIQVIVENARLLRPLWQMSGGKLGYISFQLSPDNATDAQAMIDEALEVWQLLTEELGGTPNCVFKVPGTEAGLEVVKALVSRGIGVNVTVTFAYSQILVFGTIIEQLSKAPLCYLTFMAGRLDDPVGEELSQLGVENWQEIKTWASATIIQQLFVDLWCPQDTGWKKSVLLPAAGRGPWNIDRCLHNAALSPICLTIFPARQGEYNEIARAIEVNGLWTRPDETTMEQLMRSKLYRTALDPDGLTPDQFIDFEPAKRTLREFNENFQEFLDYCSNS